MSFYYSNTVTKLETDSTSKNKINSNRVALAGADLVGAVLLVDDDGDGRVLHLDVLVRQLRCRQRRCGIRRGGDSLARATTARWGREGLGARVKGGGSDHIT